MRYVASQHAAVCNTALPPPVQQRYDATPTQERH